MHFYYEVSQLGQVIAHRTMNHVLSSNPSWELGFFYIIYIPSFFLILFFNSRGASKSCIPICDWKVKSCKNQRTN